MIGLLVNRRAIGCEALCPATLVFEFAVKRFPALSFSFGIEQRKFGALIHGNVGAPGNFQQPQDMLRFFLNPLISADSSNSENIKFVGLQKYKNGLLIAR